MESLSGVPMLQMYTPLLSSLPADLEGHEQEELLTVWEKVTYAPKTCKTEEQKTGPKNNDRSLPSPPASFKLQEMGEQGGHKPQRGNTTSLRSY